ncbi:MAG: DUF4198 domain-containing protein [Firmicutes bacterium]|nr:DUF4198 domain-containing protein [Bacillota bacterium]
MHGEQFGSRPALWLEPAHLHFHHGDSARVKVLWGPAMKRDKPEQPVNWTGLVKEPGGHEYNVPVVLDRDGFNYELVFDGGPEGVYMAQAEHQAGKCHYLARVMVPFGHHVHGHGVALNRGLEIVPGDCGEFHAGDTVDLTVLDDGKPLAGTMLLATYHIYDGEGFVRELLTDGQGVLQFAFDAKGHWMFLARTTRGEDEYITTLVIPGVR